MASKQPRPLSVTRHGRVIMRPIISSDVMGNRNVEVVPVGAWVEPGDDYLQPDAIVSAQLEEEKIRQLKEEKENKLRTFQHRVKQRVSQATRLKRQQKIQEAEQAFELEHKVVHQSFLNGDIPRRDTYKHGQNLDVAIRKRLLEKYGEDCLTWKNDPVPPLQIHAEESHNIIDKARQQLISRKIIHNGSGDNASTEWRAKVIRHQTPTITGVLTMGTIPASKSTYHKVKDVTIDNNSREDFALPGHQPLTENDEDNAVEIEIATVDDDSGEEDTREGPRSVQFSKAMRNTQLRQKKRSQSARRPRSAQLAAILSTDTDSDITARQRSQQTAISRRVFMDRERETVRENIRRQKHRQRIKSLKREKEEYRQYLEEVAHRQLEMVNSVTDETSEEDVLREKLEAMHLKKMVDQRKKELKKAREMERYLDALRLNLIKKVKHSGLQFPSLCACGDNVWDTHPDTCANNCFFYKNPRAYVRALQSLLSSTEIV